MKDPIGFRYAARGIIRTIATERNIKIHLVIAVLALLACAALKVSTTGWALVIICIGCVIAAELINTALERLCDRVTTENDPLIGQAKDAAAGAVVIFAVMSVIVGLIVYLPPLIGVING